MRWQRHGVAALVAGVALTAAACGGGDDATPAPDTTETTSTETTGGGEPMITGSVGPGFEISVDQSTVAAGTTTLVVDDRSSSHNFHITGPAVDEATEVSAEGTETFVLELQPGTYTFVCDPHAASMRGQITVE